MDQEPPTIASTESSIVVGTEPETTWLPAQGNTWQMLELVYVWSERNSLGEEKVSDAASHHS